MNPLELLAGQARWAGENIAHNLEFVPDDKLTWKPAPSAKSALEIANHTVAALKGFAATLKTGSWNVPEFTPATNRAQAQAMIREATGEYAAAVAALTPADLGRTVQAPFGSFPMREFSGFGAIELVHHRGQIAYLQTLWGDQEDHFGR